MIERYELSKLIVRHEQMYAEMLGERQPAG